MHPKVSIIIPTYNRVSLLGETLDSIIGQTYLNWECLVVDDGSIDHTRELMEFYIACDPRISFHNRPKEKPKGANSCRNYGFKISTGEFINWFDDDDIMHPDKLKLQVITLKYNNYNFSVCHIQSFNEYRENLLGYRKRNIYSDQAFFDFLIMKIGFMTPSVLWRKTFLLNSQNELFDEELQAAQEWEFHCRMLHFSEDYHYSQMVLVFLRKHSNSISYNSEEENRFYHYFLARLKIYRNPAIRLDLESQKFLQKYLLNSFKNMIVSNNKNNLKAFKKFVIWEENMNISTRLWAFLSILSFRLFNKGNVFLQKIKFSK